MSANNNSVLVATALLIFVFLASFNIAYPGLYYDEVLFLNAALGGHSDLFIHRRLFDIPVMLMPYIGALKAWLYYPIFKLFDVSVFSIRLPVVLIGALTLWLTYKLVKTLFGVLPATIFILLAAVEPSTIFHTRLDWGPTTLMMLFRSLLLLSLFIWLMNGEKKYLIFALACCVIGVFDKLNFIWISVAAFSAAFIVYPAQFTDIVRIGGRYKLFYISLLFITLILSSILLRNISLFNEIGGFNFLTRASYVYNMIIQMLSGDGVYSFVVGESHQFVNYQLSFVILLAVLSSVGIAYGCYMKTILIRPLIFIFVFILLLFIQLFITKQATGPHHMVTLAPLWLIPISVGLAAIASFRVGNGFEYGMSTVVIFSAILFVSSLMVASTYHEAFIGKVRPRWDVASSELVKNLPTHSSRPVVSVDWGSATIVQGLSQNKLKIFDFWPWFNNGISGEDLAWFEREFVEKGAIFIVSSPGTESFPETRHNFLALVNERKWNVSRLETISNCRGEGLYELYYSN